MSALPTQGLELTTAPKVLQSPPGTQPGVTHLHTEIDKGTEDEEFGPDFFDTTFGEIDLEEIDRLALVDDHRDEDQHKLDSEAEVVHQPSLLPQSPSRPRSTSPNNQASLLQDPYSSLSPLQRDILIQIQENAPFFPNGVPIRALYRRVGRSTDRYSELHIR